MAAPVLTLTLNPCLDLSAETDRVQPGPKLRLSPPRREPGGGGVNVARAVRRLGGEALALVALGGAIGQQVEALLAAEHLPLRAVPAPGETRESLVVTERASGAQYRFILPGAAWPETAVETLLSAAEDLLRPDQWVVLSGSQPPGVSDHFPLQLETRLAARGARQIIDTSGAALAALLRHPGPVPAVLRLDQTEAETLAGGPLTDLAAAADLASRQVAAGVAEVVVVACGAEGSVLATREQRWHCRVPPVAVVSRTGAGDSFTGAFALSLARGEAWPEVLRWGTAAAAAAVLTPGSELCRRGDVERLYAEAVLNRL